MEIGRRRFGRLHNIGLNSERFNRLIRERGIIHTNRKSYGIPQGLPISGLLANMVMFEVDVAVNNAAKGIGGSYRRYSDDILIIAPIGRSGTVLQTLSDELKNLDLIIQKTKTNSVEFYRGENEDLHTKNGKTLQYLGLSFDGSRVLIRPQTLVKFNKRMFRAVRRARNAAIKNTPKGKPIRLRRRDIYARFSHLAPHRETPMEKRPRGSFMRYAKHAGDVVNQQGMKANFNSQIRRQLRGQWKHLQRMIKEAEQL